MNWSMRSALLWAGVFLLFVSLSVAIQRWIVYPQFQVLEAQEVERATARLLAGVQSESDNLADFVADYAEWDSAWDFAETMDREFLTLNFTTSAFQRANFHMVWIVKTDGRILYRANYNNEEEQLEEIFADAGERLLEGHPFLRALSGHQEAGIFPTATGPALVAAHPILNSNAEGPVRGVLVMGLRIEKDLLERMNNKVQLPVDAPELMGWRARLTPGVPHQRRLDSGPIETTILWNDLFGNPGAVFNVQVPRDITALGRRALLQSTFAVMAQGALFLAIAGLVIQRSLSRSRKAELARLLEERTAALRDAEQYLKTIMESVPIGLIVVESGQHRILDVNQAALDMIKARREDVLGQVCHTFICPAEVGKCPITDLGRVCDRAERVLLRKDGDPIPVLKTVVPTHLRGQNCLLECFVDIREQKEAEEQLRKSVEDLGRLNRSMLGREERVLELKKEINHLLAELGRPARYQKTETETTPGETA